MEFSYRMTFGAIILMASLLLIAIVVNSIGRGDQVDPEREYGPAHNYAMPWVDQEHDSITWGYSEDEVTRGVSIDPLLTDEKSVKCH